ncbi:MAG: hypothetical protein NVSMB21_22580 [Vulcanimicrobiaceae bacterium]
MAAVRIEDVKAAGIAVDIDALAADGFASISEEDRYRLKTQGVCTQRQVGAFMLRIRVPGGAIAPRALRRCAELADRYGNPVVHVTSRGGLELHHIKIEDVSAVFAGLDDVGLTTKGTCGDTIRNVIACPHAGIFAGEVVDLAPFVRLVHERIVARSDETNLSRKMNVAFACSPYCDDHVATSDIGFVATASPDGGAPTFALWGAGGLGAAPRLAIELCRDLAQTDVVAAFDAVVAIGIKHGDRSSRAKAKIKMLVERWGIERVREVFAEEFALARAAGSAVEIDAPLPPRGESGTVVDGAFVPSRLGDAVAQKQPGRYTVAALVPMGELTTAAARGLADAATIYGDGIVYLTPDQNAELHDVAEFSVPDALATIRELGLRTAGRGGIADVLSCVGLEYCPLAVAHSMTMGEELALAFAAHAGDARFHDFRIHVSGCPHSCAKHQVADIGLAGAQTDVDGRKVEAYAFYVGGNARERRLGTMYPKKIPRANVVAVVRALTDRYVTERTETERFSQTVARVGVAAYFETIAATLAPRVAPVVRSGRLVVIGNGMAGARFIEELRERASEAFDITVLGDEPHGGYNRIMLSSVLGGTRDASEIVTHPLPWYDDRRVELKLGSPVLAIDRARRVVRTADGAETPYDALVLATGSRPFVPPILGLAAARNVFVFRTLADCESIRAAASTAKTAVVLGGGLLGLEAAAGLRALGVTPTVVHLMPTLMDVQLDSFGGRALEAKIETLGIAICTGAKAVAAYDDARGRGIELDDGTVVAGDLIVVCCGTKPNAELARDAGLACARGIVVDDGLRTNDERIFALGECAEHRGELYGLVEPLWDQCRTLADRLTGGEQSYGGSKVGTRLKVAGVNVVAVGERDARVGDEVILALGADGSFRRAIARDGRLCGAQVVGDATSAAAFARAYERGAPLPGSLAAFVFGVDGIGGGSAVPACDPNDRICVCNEVSRGEILDAIAAGAHDVAEIGRRTMAGTGCGTCRGELALLVIGAKETAVEAS